MKHVFGLVPTSGPRLRRVQGTENGTLDFDGYRTWLVPGGCLVFFTVDGSKKLSDGKEYNRNQNLENASKPGKTQCGFGQGSH